MVRCLSCCQLLASTFPAKSEWRSCRKVELPGCLKAAEESDLLLHERQKKKKKQHPSEFHFVWCLWPSHPLPTAVMVSPSSPGMVQAFIRVSSTRRWEWELCGRVWSASSKVNCGFKKKTGGGFLSVSACWVEIDGRKCFMVQGFLGSRGFVQFITTSFYGSFFGSCISRSFKQLI